MAGTGALPLAAIIALAVLAVLALAAAAYVFRARRPNGGAPAVGANDASGGNHGEGLPGAASASRVPPADAAGSPWPGGSLPHGLSPHIRPGVLAAAGSAGSEAGPGSEAPGSVSFGIGMTGIQLEEGALQVLWHGINDGAVPVAIQWGRPEVRVEGDRIEVRYVYDVQGEASGPFQPPRTRPLGPDEIVSRTALVPLGQIGRDPAGMAVQVFVAFGSASELAAAQAGREAYRNWQQITYTRPRTIPKS